MSDAAESGFFPRVYDELKLLADAAAEALYRRVRPNATILRKILPSI